MYEKWHQDFTKAKVKVKVSILVVDALNNMVNAWLLQQIRGHNNRFVLDTSNSRLFQYKNE